MLDLQKELIALKAKVADLESRILFPNEPVAKWQPKGGHWAIDIDGGIMESVSDELIISFGVVRQTKEQAERAAVEMRRFNRLLALRDELCGDELVHLYNHSDVPYDVNVGDRIAQLLTIPINLNEYVEVDEFSTVTERGEGGFGSTGV
jgi:hypothetical protein